MNDKDSDKLAETIKDRRIAELERQLRIAKEEQWATNEQSQTLRQMVSDMNNVLHNLLSHSDIGAMCLDKQMHIISVTPGIQEHFHIRNEDIGRPLTDLVSNLLYDNLEQDIKDVMASSKLKEIITPSQDGRWFNMRIFPHQQMDGTDDGVVITLADITHLKKRETQLKNKDKKILDAIKSSPIVVWNQDLKLRYTWIHNPHPGFEPKEVIGKTDEDLLPPHEATILTKIKQKVLDTGIGAREKVTTTIQGVTYYYDLAIEPLTDEKSNVIGISCASMEISKEEFEFYKHKHND